jgi:hypothetical protein
VTPKFRVEAEKLVVMPVSHGSHRTQLRKGQVIDKWSHGDLDYLRAQGLVLTPVE